ncbi:MAG: ATP-binding protein [Oligoflexia bacterium]|nr:ATP-binding protein [Oligoflexia bacterium]
MRRELEKKLVNWKENPRRKPLILMGARQVGKTYLLKQFAEKFFSKYIYIDFYKSVEVQQIFKANRDPRRIVQDLEILLKVDISLESDLIIFDEIQYCEEALASLKYFCQDFENAYICAAGSMLGLSLTNDMFPVGKVEFLTLYPMTFFEFLEGIGESKLLNNLLQYKANISEYVHREAFKLLKLYFFAGGLPEVVLTVRDGPRGRTTYEKVRAIQSDLLRGYLNDIAKHSGKIKSLKIESVFKNIPQQLARENTQTSKFIFKDVLDGASKYEQLQGSIEWLIRAGLIYQVTIVNEVKLPLSVYANEKKFKLYLFDVGMLGCMVDLSLQTLLDYDYGSFKGYFAENFVLQELRALRNKDLFSWNRNASEIEFVLDFDGIICPIEVKSGINTKAKSLQVYKSLYSPKRSFLLSGNPPTLGKDLHQLPLYFASMLKDFID